MTSAYGASSDSTSSTFTGKAYADLLPYIPFRGYLRDETSVWLDFPHTNTDAQIIQNLLNDRIEEGESWPFDKPLNEKEFREYFFAHTALVARVDSGDIIGAFYCKPNFPGRCSHYCNGGFITHPSWRRRGVAQFMAVTYLRVAKDLGFKAALFNLVFVSNVPSVALWDKLGFKRLCTLYQVGNLKKHGFTDAHQYFYNLDSLNYEQISQIILDGVNYTNKNGKESGSASKKVNDGDESENKKQMRGDGDDSDSLGNNTEHLQRGEGGHVVSVMNEQGRDPLSNGGAERSKRFKLRMIANTIMIAITSAGIGFFAGKESASSRSEATSPSAAAVSSQ